MSESEKSSQKLLERCTMFNDAVYAIVLTILVLELKLPGEAGHHFETADDMWHAIKEMSPILFAYGLSIALVGSNWISSVNIQRTMDKANSGTLIFMVTYLSLISVTPFTCHLIGEHPGNPMSYVAFGVLTILICINGGLFLIHCRKNNLYHKDADMKEIMKMEKAVYVIPFFIAAMTLSAYYSTVLSFCLFMIYNLLPFFISKSLRVNHQD